jgi:integrase
MHTSCTPAGYRGRYLSIARLRLGAYPTADATDRYHRGAVARMRGSVRKRGSTWTYVMYMGRDADGKKRHQWRGGFRTRRECEAALTEALERRRTGTRADPGKQTVGEFLTQWLAATTPSLRDSTAANYDVIVAKWVLPRIGNQRLANLDAARIQALYGELSVSGRRDGGPLSPRSVRYVHAILQHALGDAVRWGVLPRNPAQFVDPPRQQRAELKVWSVDQVRAFLQHVAGDRLHALWLLMIATGMRRGEALGLRWGDVDFQRTAIAIRRSRVVTDGWTVAESEPQTSRGRRLVRVDPATMTALRTWRKEQVAEQLRAGDMWQGGEWVFADEVGAPLHPQRVTRMFGRLVQESGLPELRLHGLRHTSATLALAAGIHPRVEADRLGHSTVQLTLELYSHAVESVGMDAAAKMGTLIYGADSG